ncbi:MAG: hypothetical protein K2H82_00535 [Oscillospiraceae bacterium]|nr:hypothetical protein [Oscillospiraceae bacterium]
MFTIKRKDMENATKQPDAKTKFASTDSTIYDSFKLSIWNMIDMLKDLSVYDMAQWINHIDRWIKTWRIQRNTAGVVLYL